MATNTRGPVKRTTNNQITKPKTSFRWKPADPKWHPEIIGLYNSLKKSAHFDEFQESDMYHARIVAETHSFQLQNKLEMNAALIKTLFAEWKELGTTMGTRKRLAIEVEKIVEDKKSAELMEMMARSIVTGIPIGSGDR
jgi:hypothetical protein